MKKLKTYKQLFENNKNISELNLYDISFDEYNDDEILDIFEYYIDNYTKDLIPLIENESIKYFSKLLKENILEYQLNKNGKENLDIICKILNFNELYLWLSESQTHYFSIYIEKMFKNLEDAKNIISNYLKEDYIYKHPEDNETKEQNKKIYFFIEKIKSINNENELYNFIKKIKKLDYFENEIFFYYKMKEHNWKNIYIRHLRRKEMNKFNI